MLLVVFWGCIRVPARGDWSNNLSKFSGPFFKYRSGLAPWITCAAIGDGEDIGPVGDAQGRSRTGGQNPRETAAVAGAKNGPRESRGWSPAVPTPRRSDVDQAARSATWSFLNRSRQFLQPLACCNTRQRRHEAPFTRGWAGAPCPTSSRHWRVPAGRMWLAGRHHHFVSGASRQQLGLQCLQAVTNIIDHLDTGFGGQTLQGVWVHVVGPVIDKDDAVSRFRDERDQDEQADPESETWTSR